MQVKHGVFIQLHIHYCPVVPPPYLRYLGLYLGITEEVITEDPPKPHF